MRKYQKDQCMEILSSLDEADKEILSLINGSLFDEAARLLEESQQCAIKLGELIDRAEGEGTAAVRHLEEYCELIYRLHEAILSGSSTNCTHEEKRLGKCITDTLDEINHQLPTRYEAVFFPYKASMWDSLESVWMAASKDPDCDAYVIPIPYCDRNPDGSAGTIYYEGDQFPEYVPITKFSDYDLQSHHPEMVYIHNPYDEWNTVTSVHPDYYSYVLKQFTDCLVYIPYYSTSGKMHQAMNACLSYYIVDYIAVQSGEMVEQFDESIPREKLLPLGSPKFDRVIRLSKNSSSAPEEWKEKLTGKKVFFYNTSINGMLFDTEGFLRKMKYVFETFKQIENACVLWRPHPLLESTFESMRYDHWTEYQKLKHSFIVEGIGIYDDTPDIERSIALCDAYLGDAGSSVVSLFGVCGKPVYLLDNTIQSAPDEDDWKSAIYTAPDWLDNDVFRIQLGNKLFKRDRTYHYRLFCELPGKAYDVQYISVLELSGKLFVFSANTERILMINEDKSIRSIELRHTPENGSLFYSVVHLTNDMRYVFLLPDKYPYLVRLDTQAEKIDHIEGVSGFNILETEKDGRLKAYAGIDPVRREVFFLNPEGTEMLTVDMESCQIDKRPAQVNMLATNVCAAGLNSDNWYFLPFEGTDIVEWDRRKDFFETIHIDVEGLASFARPKMELCNRNYYSNAAFIERKMILAPFWGNKFVELDLDTHMAREWIPPFEIMLEDKSAYWKNRYIGYFIIDGNAWTNDRLETDVKFYHSPDGKIFNLNLKTREYCEFEVIYDKAEIYAQTQGFSDKSENIPYYLGESLFNSLGDIITGNTHGNQFDKRAATEAYKRINASPEGDCGEKIYHTIKGKLGLPI